MSYEVVTSTSRTRPRRRTEYATWLRAMRAKLSIIKRWPGAKVDIVWNPSRQGAR